MTIRRPHPAAVFATLALAAAALLICAWLAGCKGPPVSTPPANNVTVAEQLRSQQRLVTETIQPKLWKVGDLVTGLTVENVNTTKPQLEQLVGTGENKMGLIQDFSKLVDNGGKIELAHAKEVDHTRAVEKENTQLKAKPDPMKGWFELVGGVLSGLGVSVLVLGFLPLPWTAWAAPLRGYAITAAIVGFTLLTLARFLNAIEWIIAGTLGAGFLAGVVLLGYYAWKNRQKFMNTVDHISAGVAAGQIIITPAAKDPRVSVSKAWLDDATAAEIQTRQAAFRTSLDSSDNHTTSPANDPSSVSPKPTSPAASPAVV